MNKPSYITVPKGVKYLSDVPELSEGLPENCLFNKILTGAGGTYVALTSKNPYVIAVPTKALVEDKIRSSRYAHVKLLAVSGDYNFTNHHLLVGNKTFIKSFSSQTSKSVSGILDNSELAPQLSMATKKKYKTAKIGVKAFVELYNENKLLAKEEDYELYEALEDLGEAVFKKCSYYRARIKTAHENFKKSSKYAPKAKLLYHFQVGSSMTDERIKKELSQRFGITKNHIAWLSKHFELKRTSIRGASARRILRYVGQ